MDYNNDIVARLRLYAERQKQTRSKVLGLLLSDSADEIERLHKERDEAMALIENIANEVNVLSTRPAAIIKFSDLVDQINEWGDAARKILGSKENTDG